MLTNKQAIEYIDSILSNYDNPKEVDRHYPDYRLCEVWLSRYDIETLKMAKDTLEQEPILDKIRAEIEFEVDHRTNMLCAEDVFAILDKYKAESER